MKFLIPLFLLFAISAHAELKSQPVTFSSTYAKVIAPSGLIVPGEAIIGPTSNPTASVVTVTAASYALLATESMVLVDTTSNAIAIQLVTPATTNGGYRIFKIKDIAGKLSTNALTLVRFGSEKIEGVAATKTFTTDYGSWTVLSNGTDWFIL